MVGLTLENISGLTHFAQRKFLLTIYLEELMWYGDVTERQDPNYVWDTPVDIGDQTRHWWPRSHVTSATVSHNNILDTIKEDGHFFQDTWPSSFKQATWTRWTIKTIALNCTLLRLTSADLLLPAIIYSFWYFSDEIFFSSSYFCPVLLSALVFLLLRELLKDLAMLQLKRSQKSEQEPMVRCLMRILSTTSTSR